MDIAINIFNELLIIINSIFHKQHERRVTNLHNQYKHQYKYFKLIISLESQHAPIRGNKINFCHRENDKFQYYAAMILL